jgi:hypothetical protein
VTQKSHQMKWPVSHRADLRTVLLQKALIPPFCHFPSPPEGRPTAERDRGLPGAIPLCYVKLLERPIQARVAAGAFGFLILSQIFDGPDL